MHLVLFSLLFPAYEKDNFCLKMASHKELSIPLVPRTIEIKVSRPSPIKITYFSLNMSLTLFSIWLLAAILDLLRIAESSSIIVHRSHYLSFPLARRYLLRQREEVEFKEKKKPKKRSIYSCKLYSNHLVMIQNSKLLRSKSLSAYKEILPLKYSSNSGIITGN